MLNSQDEICVQLKRAPTDSSIISAHVRVLRPEPHDAAEVKVAGPGISPGTFRSTPWGMLLRVVPEKKVTLEPVKVEPGTGESITAGPVGGGVGVRVGVAVTLGVAVGVGVGPAMQVENLNEPIRVTQFNPETGKYMFVYQNVQSSVGSTLIAL